MLRVQLSTYLWLCAGQCSVGSGAVQQGGGGRYQWSGDGRCSVPVWSWTWSQWQYPIIVTPTTAMVSMTSDIIMCVRGCEAVVSGDTRDRLCAVCSMVMMPACALYLCPPSCVQHPACLIPGQLSVRETTNLYFYFPPPCSGSKQGDSSSLLPCHSSVIHQQLSWHHSSLESWVNDQR